MKKEKMMIKRIKNWFKRKEVKYTTFGIDTAFYVNDVQLNSFTGFSFHETITEKTEGSLIVSDNIVPLSLNTPYSIKVVLNYSCGGCRILFNDKIILTERGCGISLDDFSFEEVYNWKVVSH